jgi:hypothetical protein
MNATEKRTTTARDYLRLLEHPVLSYVSRGCAKKSIAILGPDTPAPVDLSVLTGTVHRGVFEATILQHDGEWLYHDWGCRPIVEVQLYDDEDAWRKATCKSQG